MEIKEISAEETYEIRHKVMWKHKNIAFVKVPDDTEGVHFGLYEDEKLISVVSLFYKNDEVQFRKFATLEDYQNKGYGTILLNYIMQKAEEKEIKRIWCNARRSKKDFYTRFGLKETEKSFIKEGIEFIVMEKIL